MDKTKPEQTGKRVFLYIGAGLASDMDYFVARSPSRLVLIEPNPDLAEYLEEQCARHAFLRFQPHAICTDPEEAHLHIFNHFEMSSLSPSDHLFDVFPGLELEKTVAVETMTPHELLSRHRHSDRATTVIIDVPGAAAELLEAMLASEHLPAIGEIYVKPDDPVIFPDGIEIVAWQGRLRSHGFKLCDHAETDQVKFVFDPLCAELADTQRLLGKAQKRNDDLVAQNEDLRRELEEEAQKVLKLHEQAQEENTAQVAEIEDLRRQLEKATREKSVLTTDAETRQRRLDVALKMQAIAQSNLSDLQRKYSDLRLEHEQLETLLQTLYARLSEARHYLNGLPDEGSGKGES